MRVARGPWHATGLVGFVLITASIAMAGMELHVADSSVAERTTRLTSALPPPPEDAVAGHPEAPSVSVAVEATEPPAAVSTISCGGTAYTVSLDDIAHGPGSITSISAGTDVQRDPAASHILFVRVTFAGGTVPAHSLMLDVDDDRFTGMWTKQSSISGSGWDVLVDSDGRLLHHAGTPTTWSWAPAGTAERSTAGDTAFHCIPIPESSDRVRITVTVADASLPMTFLPGAAYPPEPVAPVRPGSTPAGLAFHYGGAPWTVEGCTDPRCAAEMFASSAHVVFGSGLEDRKHPGHVGTTHLIRDIKRSGRTEVWGYVSLVGSTISADGRRESVWSARDILARAEAWRSMGVTGIFIDEADLCSPSRGQSCPQASNGTAMVDRAKQAEIVRGIHALGLAVFANAFSPLDLLGLADGKLGVLSSGQSNRPADMYLLENPTVSAGVQRDGIEAAASAARFEMARRYAAAAGVRIAVVDTFGSRPAPDLHRLAFERAADAGAHAFGFTNASFSADPAHASLPTVPDVPKGILDR